VAYVTTCTGAARFCAAALTNRELSSLSFGRRVLAVAEDPEQPVLERVKFAGSWA